MNIRAIQVFVGLAGIIAAWSGAKAWAFGPSKPANDPVVVSDISLERYAGTWKEIARYPTPFQAGCARSTAEYGVLVDGRSLSVLNTCERADGSQSTIKGTATIPHPEAPAKLRVDFGWFRVGDYWIVDLDSDYSRAIVSGPGSNSLFVLSREAPLTSAGMKDLLKRLGQLGFDTSRLVYDEWN